MIDFPENVIWKSRDDRWSRGFFAYKEGQGDDYENDLEYDAHRFSWVSTGHASETNARASWKGIDPKKTNIFLVACPETDKFDLMASDCLMVQAEKKKVSP